MSVLDFEKDLTLLETKIHDLEQINVLKRKEGILKIISILHYNFTILLWIFNYDNIVSTFLCECSDFQPKLPLFTLSLPAELMLFLRLQLQKKAFTGLEGFYLLCGLYFFEDPRVQVPLEIFYKIVCLFLLQGSLIDVQLSGRRCLNNSKSEPQHCEKERKKVVQGHM